ncbi:hypothetical protein KAS10_00845 [Candidatus Aerophobetes bacterium]|nr:hypothetical protein [Candidatus Aerophobetes bacterium]
MIKGLYLSAICGRISLLRTGHNEDSSGDPENTFEEKQDRIRARTH